MPEKYFHMRLRLSDSSCLDYIAGLDTSVFRDDEMEAVALKYARFQIESSDEAIACVDFTPLSPPLKPDGPPISVDRGFRLWHK
jgi:hypothetical protein